MLEKDDLNRDGERKCKVKEKTHADGQLRGQNKREDLFPIREHHGTGGEGTCRTLKLKNRVGEMSHS